MFKTLLQCLEWREKAMHELVGFAQPLYRQLSKRKSIAWDTNTKKLLQLPPQSLGHTLGEFLNEHQFALMPQFENHDVFHILLAYEPTVLDEARMQFCLVGSGKKSLFSLGTCVIALLFYPEYLMDFKQHFRRGKSLNNFSSWDFEKLLTENFIQLQQSLSKKSVKRANDENQTPHLIIPTAA